jgi:hypothetical protein
LLERARAEAAENRREIAITLYATWLEHFINGLLALVLDRRGLPPATTKSLLRELRLPTKASALWQVVGLPPLDESDIRLVEHVGNLRNAFVHYKWQAASEQAHDAQDRLIQGAIDDLEGLIARLIEVEHRDLWHGRRDELLLALRAHLHAVEEAKGPFLSMRGRAAPSNRAPEPPSNP